ncbi:hypothetical protein GECvBN5_gp029 [Salmonella phage GEC_vB_N5]|uniref:Uncharacterized protein n=1 Tax=Salmonella phage GEC_vB_N5 TaxID=2777378 RepID=A0A7S9SRJ9_9CAUD|nr:hypothetical protein GECvBN5_gp029 [Salmonella phage GEC_vB_N5]
MFLIYVIIITCAAMSCQEDFVNVYTSSSRLVLGS